MTPKNNEIIKELKRLEEDSQFSSKSHFEASRRWNWWHYGLGIPTVILASIAGISSFGDYPLFSGVLAIFSSALTAIITFLNPSNRASEHFNAGNSYLALKNESRILRNIKINQLNEQSQLAYLEELSNKKNELNLSLPQIPERCFKKARDNIEEGQCSYDVDAIN